METSGAGHLTKVSMTCLFFSQSRKSSSQHAQHGPNVFTGRLVKVGHEGSSKLSTVLFTLENFRDNLVYNTHLELDLTRVRIRQVLGTKDKRLQILFQVQ